MRRVCVCSGGPDGSDLVVEKVMQDRRTDVIDNRCASSTEQLVSPKSAGLVLVSINLRRPESSTFLTK